MSNPQNEISSLSGAEKFELLDALWESLETETPALTDAQRVELDDRAASYEQNPAAVVPWEQVRANLFRHYPPLC